MSEPTLASFLERDLPRNYLKGSYDNGRFVGLQSPRFDEAAHALSGDGWKFHLSIDPEDVAKAWDVVTPILIKNDVGAAKVATEATALRFHNPDHGQAGKQITIYGAGSTSWDAQMNEIELALRMNNIRPSAPINGDRMIPGSAYIGYRNEKASEDLQKLRDPTLIDLDHPYYVSSHEIRNDLIPRGVVLKDMAHNPSGFPDSLQHIDFTDEVFIRAAEHPLPPNYDRPQSVKAGRGKGGTYTLTKPSLLQEPVPPLQQAQHLAPLQRHPQQQQAARLNPSERDTLPDIDPPVHVPENGNVAGAAPKPAVQSLEAVSSPAGSPVPQPKSTEAAVALENAEKQSLKAEASALTREAANSSRALEAGVALAPVVIDAVLSGSKAASEGKSPGQIAKATGYGALNGAVGVEDVDVALNRHKRFADRSLGALRAATALATTGLAVSAPLSGGATSLPATAAGIANVSLGVIQDVAHWTGIADDKGTLETVYDISQAHDKMLGANEKAELDLHRSLLPLNAVAVSLYKSPEIHGHVSDETGKAISRFHNINSQDATVRLDEGAQFAKQIATDLNATTPSGDAVRAALEPVLQKSGTTPQAYAAALTTYGTELAAAAARIRGSTSNDHIQKVQEAANHLLDSFGAGSQQSQPTGPTTMTAPLPGTFDAGRQNWLVLPNNGGNTPSPSAGVDAKLAMRAPRDRAALLGSV